VASYTGRARLGLKEIESRCLAFFFFFWMRLRKASFIRVGFVPRNCVFLCVHSMSRGLYSGLLTAQNGRPCMHVVQKSLFSLFFSFGLAAGSVSSEEGGHCPRSECRRRP
jgi:hypothetical protein